MDPRLLATLAHVRYPTHYVYVYQYDHGGRIHCLKYSHTAIQWSTFDYCDWDMCKEYMIIELPEQLSQLT